MIDLFFTKSASLACSSGGGMAASSRKRVARERTPFHRIQLQKGVRFRATSFLLDAAILPPELQAKDALLVKNKSITVYAVFFIVVDRLRVGWP